MTITKAILSVGLTALLFGVAGGLVGYGIGRFFPGYYRQVFYIRDPQVTPEDLGVGLGITQGLMWGIVTGTNPCTDHRLERNSVSAHIYWRARARQHYNC
jgi:hypothetical protein